MERKIIVYKGYFKEFLNSLDARPKIKYYMC